MPLRPLPRRGLAVFLQDVHDPWQNGGFADSATDLMCSAVGMMAFIGAKQKACRLRTGSNQFSLRRRKLHSKVKYRELLEQVGPVADRRRSVTLLEVPTCFAICCQVAGVAYYRQSFGCWRSASQSTHLVRRSCLSCLSCAYPTDPVHHVPPIRFVPPPTSPTSRSPVSKNAIAQDLISLASA